LAPSIPAVGERVVLDKASSHHLLRVTGIAPGESVEIFDGRGVCAIAALITVVDGCAVLGVTQLGQPDALNADVHLVLAQLRASTLDGVLRMVTELGVASIQMISTERAVAKGDKRQRWERIVAAAAAQCGRVTVPIIRPPCSWAEGLEAQVGQRLALLPSAGFTARSDGALTLLVGPEGGFSAGEVEELAMAGWCAAGLGGLTLRADTAAVAAVVKYGGLSR